MQISLVVVENFRENLNRRELRSPHHKERGYERLDHHQSVRFPESRYSTQDPSWSRGCGSYFDRFLNVLSYQ